MWFQQSKDTVSSFVAFSQLISAEDVSHKKIKLKNVKQEFDATWKT
jgi:hypothetical protein